MSLRKGGSAHLLPIISLTLCLAACGGQSTSTPWHDDTAGSEATGGYGRDEGQSGEGGEHDGPRGVDGEDESSGAGSASNPYAVSDMTLENAGGSCVAESDVIVERHTAQRLSGLKLGFGRQGGLLAWARDAETLSLVPVGADGQPSGFTRSETMPLARGLERLIPIEEGFLLISQLRCSEGTAEAGTGRCLHARAFSHQGAPLGEASPSLSTFGGAQIEESIVSADDVLIAWTQRLKGHYLYRFRVSKSGATEVERVASIKSVVWDEGSPIKSYHCGLESGRLVALEEDAGAERWSLIKAAGEGEPTRTALSGLVSKATPLACEPRSGGGVTLVYLASGSVERFIVELGGVGRPTAPPRVIERGDAPPAPFSHRLAAEIFTDRPRGESIPWPVRLQRRIEATDQELGRAFELGQARSPFMTGPEGALTWTGRHVLLSYGEHRDGVWRIHLAKVDCRRRE